MGIFPASVPLENPQWQAKMALFAGEGAALNAYGAIFVQSEQQITIKSAQWTRQKMQNWEILCWIVSGSPPFRLTFPNRSFLLLPHCHRNPVKSYFSYFWRMEQNIHKKYQVLNFKMARDEKKRVERRHSSGALSTAHHHPRTFTGRLTSALAWQPNSRPC